MMSTNITNHNFGKKYFGQKQKSWSKMEFFYKNRSKIEISV